jgi:hypothetical protein
LARNHPLATSLSALRCSAPGDWMPPCGRADFGPEISCGATCFISMRPSTGCRLAFAQAVAAGPKRNFGPLYLSLGSFCMTDDRNPRLRGALPNFLGCSLDPFPFASAIKCYQKSPCNSAGSSVGSLAPPLPGHPTAGRCGRVVPVLPLLLCTRPERARPSVGGQNPPPAPR